MPTDSWDNFSAAQEEFRAALRKSRAVNVNTANLRDEAKSLVQDYFRSARPELLRLGFDESAVQPLDEEMQRLLELSNGRNAKASYQNVLAKTRKLTATVASQREMALGQQAQSGPTLSDVEGKILATLDQLVPSAATSYQQALLDLSHGERVSYRGTANELREALREVLDRLAPDDEVAGQENFKLEKGQLRPTQKQKVRFILSQRSLTSTERQAPEKTVELIDELTASVARSSYQRSSVSAHVGATLGEIRQLKMYVDTVLAEVLEIHV